MIIFWESLKPPDNNIHNFHTKNTQTPTRMSTTHKTKQWQETKLTRQHGHNSQFGNMHSTNNNKINHQHHRQQSVSTKHTLSTASLTSQDPKSDQNTEIKHANQKERLHVLCRIYTTEHIYSFMVKTYGLNKTKKKHWVLITFYTGCFIDSNRSSLY